MNIIYRISDSGYNKIKPNYINNENCLKNAVEIFKDDNWSIIADNVSDKTSHMINQYEKPFSHVSIGHGSGTFNLALDEALKYKDDQIIYFLENDYLHKPNSSIIIQEGIDIGADYITLYDHPDKYLDPNYGGNPYCQGGGEETRVYLTKNTHWKITNSTTMTFASKVSTLREDEEILRKWTKGTYPEDFQMFLELRSKGKILLSSIPGYSTHGETQWLSPLIKWNEI